MLSKIIRSNNPKKKEFTQDFPSFCFQAFLLELYFHVKMKTKHLIYHHIIIYYESYLNLRG